MVASGLHHYNAVAILFILGPICTHRQVRSIATGQREQRCGSSQQLPNKDMQGCQQVPMQFHSIAVRVLHLWHVSRKSQGWQE